MAKYITSWVGIDRGHEGQWDPRVWISPLRALKEYGSLDYNDLGHKFYQYVQNESPDVVWVSTDKKTGEKRSLFRDNRETWAATSVIEFNGTIMKLSAVGESVVRGEVSYPHVLVDTLRKWSESGEHPFGVLSRAFINLKACQGLTFADVVAVMQNYRDGDNLDEALSVPLLKLQSTSERRLKAMLLLMEYAGGIINIRGVYYPLDAKALEQIVSADFAVDRLAVAVRTFKAHRGDDDWSGKIGTVQAKWAYQAVNTGVRDYFGKLTEEKVRAFGLAELTELFTGVKDSDGKVVFEPMWSGKVGQGWPHILKAYNDAPKQVIDFIGDIAATSTALSKFAQPGFARPGGFGGSVVSELLMKFHPEEAFKYGSKTADALKAIGLQDFEPHPANFKQDEYDHVFSLAQTIQSALKDAGVTRCLEDELQPDFLTVNEFLDWVYEHPDLLADAFSKAQLEETLPPNADRLTAALKQFKKDRGDLLFEHCVFKSKGKTVLTGFTHDVIRHLYQRDGLKGFFTKCVEYTYGGDHYLKLSSGSTEIKGLFKDVENVNADQNALDRNDWHVTETYLWKDRHYYFKRECGRDMVFGDVRFKGSLSEFIHDCYPELSVRQLGEHEYGYYELESAGKRARRIDEPESWRGEAKTQYENFVSQNEKVPHAVSWYLDAEMLAECPDMTPLRALSVMAQVRPAEFATYSPMIDDMLIFTGLAKEPFPEKISIESYEANKALQGQVLAKMHELGIGKASDDDSAADYLTVNEFAWWLSEEKNKNLVDKKILEGLKMKPAEHKEIDEAEKDKKPKVKKADSDDVLLVRLRAALKTKPFAILAGHSGTGKSRMVRKLAYMTCGDKALREDAEGKALKEPGNFCMVQVKPNWHDSSDLFGYYSELGKKYRPTDFVKFICKAYAYPKVPFFVCLDEMNLAPVEQYFAEYLSAIESRKLDADDKTIMYTDELVPRSAYCVGDDENMAVHYDWLGCEYDEAQKWILKNGLTIPRNLFVVGTVNMDESTNQFSRKVLDRAMTIEMTDADFGSFGKGSVALTFGDYMGDAAVADLLAGEVQATGLETEQIDNLNALKSVLGSTSFAVAYRFANEYALYETALKTTLDPVKNEIDETIPEGTDATKLPAKPAAFDDMVLMKVLPRISGDEADVKALFYGEGGSAKEPKDNTLLKLLGADKDTASVRKIKAILARGGSYLSFWP